MLNRHIKTLLLVAGDDGERFYLRKQLLDLGYGTVLSSPEARAVPDILSNRGIDLMILGADIAGQEVVTLLSDLRSSDRPGNTALPVILMTDSEPSPYLVEAVRIGINSCIIKPFTALEFTARVDQICLYPSHFIDSALADTLAHRLEVLSHSAQTTDDDQDMTTASETINPTQFQTAPKIVQPPKSIVRENRSKENSNSQNLASAEEMSIENTSIENASAANTPIQKKNGIQQKNNIRQKNSRDVRDMLPNEARSSTKDVPPTEPFIQNNQTRSIRPQPSRTIIETDPPDHFEEMLAEHTAWLASNGREGKRACFAKKKLQAVDFGKTNLKNADFRYSDLSNANFEASILEWADFRYAQLVAANLDYAKAMGIRLRHANCSLSSLRQTVLQDADLTGSIFKGAHLADTDLTGSNLMETDFREVDLATVRGLLQHQFDKAICDQSTTPPDGYFMD